MNHVDPASPSPMRSWRVWLASVAFWCVFVWLVYGTGAVQHVVDGRSVAFLSWPALRQLMRSFGPYVLLTPILLHAARHLLHQRGRTFWWRACGSILAPSAVHSAIWCATEAPSWEPDAFLIGIMSHGFPYAAILGTGLVVEHRRVAAARERELARAQLRALRAQLQPHFLFNTLQAIGALAPRDGVLAAKMTTLLGDLLRNTLRERVTDLVSLAEEQLLLQPYLQLQQLRFADRLRIEVDIPGDLLDATVPDLLLQPLVENALQHGIEQRPGAGIVRITAARVGDTLRLEVHDDGKGLPQATAEQRFGTGLGATRDRLRALFGDHAAVTLRTNEHGGTTATVDLPFDTRRTRVA